jgi:catechol 2,3-dioxygenase-like lactoylglutathione lyase family enzyme
VADRKRECAAPAQVGRGGGCEVPAMKISLRLDHVVIAVSDWERSNRFYRDVLGAELVELDKGRFAYRFGSQQLNVHGPGSEPFPRAADPVRPGNSDLCFVWEGPIEGAVEHLQRNGVEVELGPVERHGAGGIGTSVYFRDPDGSLLELISYVG